MTSTQQRPSVPGHETELRTPDDVEAYVAKICFKTGPPRLVGVELEWTVHHDTDPARPIDPAHLTAALAPHAPSQLDPHSPHRTLPSGSTVTVEPGGQVEISTPPYHSLARLRAATGHDLNHLTEQLARAGLVLGGTGIDPYRPPRRLLRTLRYDALAAGLARHGTHGPTMMCSTAGLQVCLDSGEPDRVAARWQALHDLGPVLLAVFANSAHHAGRQSGWASARMATWLGIDPARAGPVRDIAEPSAAWARYALRAPVVCARDIAGDGWHTPPGITFADWLAGALPRLPTVADLDLHLSTLFPPVRPRGYFEVRYLDTQHPADWFPPVAVLTALLAHEATVDRVRELCAPVSGRWLTAARAGLADPAIHRVAYQVLDLACRELHRTDLAPPERQQVSEQLSQRVTRAPRS